MLRVGPTNCINESYEYDILWLTRECHRFVASLYRGRDGWSWIFECGYNTVGVLVVDTLARLFLEFMTEDRRNGPTVDAKLEENFLTRTTNPFEIRVFLLIYRSISSISCNGGLIGFSISYNVIFLEKSIIDLPPSFIEDSS